MNTWIQRVLVLTVGAWGPVAAQPLDEFQPAILPRGVFGYGLRPLMARCS